VLYEDILYLWIALLLYAFAPEYNTGLSLPVSLGLLVLKEILFLSTLSIFKKRLHHSFFLALIYSLFLMDLSILGLLKLSNSIPFGDLIVVLWFLHYYFLYRKAFFSIGREYIKLLLGIVLPFIIILFVQDLLDIFKVSFQGEVVFFLILLLISAPVLVKRLWPLKPLIDPFYRSFISSFFESQRVKIREYYLLSGTGRPFYTAGILGMFYPFRYFFISSDLLRILDQDELIGVLAHEAGHVKKRHMLWLCLIFFNFPLFLGIILFVMARLLKFSDALSSLSLIIFGFLYFRIIFAYFLRSFEREADYYSYKLLGTHVPLASALLKIGELSGQLYKKNWHHYGVLERVSFLSSLKGKERLWESFFKRLRILALLWFLGDIFLMWFLML
jgi:STE24 endopeptidase